MLELNLHLSEEEIMRMPRWIFNKRMNQLDELKNNIDNN
jgi:hypothetical protein